MVFFVIIHSFSEVMAVVVEVEVGSGVMNRIESNHQILVSPIYCNSNTATAQPCRRGIWLNPYLGPPQPISPRQSKHQTLSQHLGRADAPFRHTHLSKLTSVSALLCNIASSSFQSTLFSKRVHIDGVSHLSHIARYQVDWMAQQFLT